MIPVLQVFRQTLDLILERYSRFTLPLYLNNLTFLLKGMVAIALISFLFVAGYESVADILDNHSGIDLEVIPFLSEFNELFGALLILWIGYYTVSRKEEQEGVAEEEELVSSRKGLREYRILIVPAVIILVVHGLAYTNPIEPTRGIGGLFDQFVVPYDFQGILQELIEFGKNILLPIFLVLLMVIRGIWKELSGDLLRQYRAGYIVPPLLLFSLYAVFSSLFTFYKEVVAVISGESGLVYVLDNSLGDVLFLVAIGVGLLLLLGCFLPGFSMSMSLPLELEDELLEQAWHEREHDLLHQDSSDGVAPVADQGGPIQ